MTRTTITAIAEAAGVSTATVDRVLNERDGVRSHTRNHVLAVARRLGHGRETARTAQARMRLSFVLPAGDNSFMSLLHQHLIAEAQCQPDIDARLHLVEGFNAEKLAAQLHRLKGQADAVGLVGLDHPQVRDAIAALQASGIHICTLVSDIPTSARIAYVGIDNRAAGRLAAWLLGRFLPQGTQHDVTVFLGSLAYRGHEEREMGFRALLSEEFPHIRIGRMLEIGDDRARAYELTRRMLQEGAPAGLYNIGAGNSGIGRALQEAHVHRQTVFVGHDLTATSRRFLLDRTMDAVIDQNPRVAAREAVRLLASAIRGEPEPTYMPRLQVIFRENIPAE
ncbi:MULTISPECIES: LacI family DNA-binding transcriptional regulator [unclassified Caballeronia]|uniref:LacI family DNA-binding transcriptional regulator n=1 Tax=unclassified Caballeronia TaxID=2646786 RepID=UPI002860D2B0|nr:MULTISPECIES: LacI family DNA-binding transcriptional regulator [unclassified Caballeronia]MDR5741050.1 LacI family DNA-binding transcriptional regulator [Caballeronia sp. LZ016]MDR5806948.1 LacI family DNA-binding transcriptional regulator [Caballeronia sp. LZ019]